MHENIQASKEQLETEISKHIGAARVLGIEELSGGMINKVLAVKLDRQPHDLILKLSSCTGDKLLEKEFNALSFLKENTSFPVPEPYFYDLSPEYFGHSLLAMERIPGINMGSAVLTPENLASLEKEIAESLSELHGHSRRTFGPCTDSGTAAWPEIFLPMISSHLPGVKGKIDPETYNKVEYIVSRTAYCLTRPTIPVLVHGDVWANNIIVRETDGKYKLAAFIDPGTIYADREFELAYLDCFNTYGESFYSQYRKRHSFDEGYDLRKLFYWLNTMLIHVEIFGDKIYIDRTKAIADELTGDGVNLTT